jgi:hypothetical protein
MAFIASLTQFPDIGHADIDNWIVAGLFRRFSTFCFQSRQRSLARVQLGPSSGIHRLPVNPQADRRTSSEGAEGLKNNVWVWTLEPAGVVHMS